MDAENCKWCNKKLEGTEVGGDECNNCWEIRSRAERNLDLAEKILNSLKTGKTNV
jgi:hypothetical protein